MVICLATSSSFDNDWAWEHQENVALDDTSLKEDSKNMIITEFLPMSEMVIVTNIDDNKGKVDGMDGRGSQWGFSLTVLHKDVLLHSMVAFDNWYWFLVRLLFTILLKLQVLWLHISP